MRRPTDQVRRCREANSGPFHGFRIRPGFRCPLKPKAFKAARQICTLILFTAFRSYCSRDTGTVHEDDFPGACLFFEEGRLQPFQISSARGVCDAAFILAARKTPPFRAGM